MRYLVFDESRLGVLDGGEVVDLTASLGLEQTDAAGPLHTALSNGTVQSSVPDDLVADAPRLSLEAVALRVPLPRPGKIVGAPVNYLEHKDEMNWPTSIAELGCFLKAPSSVIGPGQFVQLPYTDVRTDQEGELGVVIGRRAHGVAAEDALQYVFGYTCLLDITVRSSEDRSTRKSFDTFTPIGPWIVTADEVPDPGALDLRCWVNGDLRQAASTSDLIFSVELLVAYVSSVMTLEPGDVIATGTPAGVGPLRDGDVVVVDISDVGRLEVGVSADRARPYGQRPGASLCRATEVG